MNKQELDWQGFPSCSLGTSQNISSSFRQGCRNPASMDGKQFDYDGLIFRWLVPVLGLNFGIPTEMTGL